MLFKQLGACIVNPEFRYYLASRLILENYNPMNFLLKLILASLFPKPKIQRKEVIDFFLLLVVCFMIVLYKVIKS